MWFCVARSISALGLLLSLACSPAVGSEKWCSELREKPKADWSANDVAGYTKHCVFE